MFPGAHHADADILGLAQLREVQQLLAHHGGAADIAPERGLVEDHESPTRVRVGATGAGMLTEMIRCQPDDDEVLQWWWSWGEPFCPASAEDIDRAAEMIRHVVTPAHA